MAAYKGCRASALASALQMTPMAARALGLRTIKDVTRKDIIEKFVAEVKLTKAGASTYYQMIKDKHEPQGKK